MNNFSNAIKRTTYAISNFKTVEQKLYSLSENFLDKDSKSEFLFFEVEPSFYKEIKKLLEISNFDKNNKKLTDWIKYTFNKKYFPKNILKFFFDNNWDIINFDYGKGKDLGMLAIETEQKSDLVAYIINNTKNTSLLDDKGKTLLNYLIENNSYNFKEKDIFAEFIIHKGVSLPQFFNNTVYSSEDFVVLDEESKNEKEIKEFVYRQKSLLIELKEKKSIDTKDIEQWFNKHDFVFRSKMGFSYINAYRKTLNELEKLVKENETNISFKSKEILNSMRLHYNFELSKYILNKIPFSLSRDSFINVRVSLKNKINVVWHDKPVKKVATPDIYKKILEHFLREIIENNYKDKERGFFLVPGVDLRKGFVFNVDTDKYLIDNIAKEFFSEDYKSQYDKLELENFFSTSIKNKSSAPVL